MTDPTTVRLVALAGVCEDMRRLIELYTPTGDGGQERMLKLLEDARKNLETHIIETLSRGDIDLTPGCPEDRPAIEGQLDLGDIELPMATMEVTAPELKAPTPPRKKRGRPAKKKTR